MKDDLRIETSRKKLIFFSLSEKKKRKHLYFLSRITKLPIISSSHRKRTRPELLARIKLGKIDLMALAKEVPRKEALKKPNSNKRDEEEKNKLGFKQRASTSDLVERVVELGRMTSRYASSDWPPSERLEQQTRLSLLCVTYLRNSD